MKPVSETVVAAFPPPAQAASISPPPEKRSPSVWLASARRKARKAFLDRLSPNALAALPYVFEFWAHPGHQSPPDGDWRTWVVLGGRGAGKTRAGAEWIRTQVEGATPDAPGVARRVALVAETRDQARDVMVFGESGIMNCTPADRRPTYTASRHQLAWPNGAEAQLFSAADPESLRGPQFDCAWSDELAKWRRGEAAWDMLQFCLRLGERPRQVVTTTPRDLRLLRDIIADEATATTSAASRANRAYLAPGFLEQIAKRYQGTALGRQELDGELLFERPGAMFRRSLIEAARVAAAPALDRVVVAVDPPVSSTRGADECGLVVAGRAGDAFYVLADRSLGDAAPDRWAAEAVRACGDFEADAIVAEVNQGGEMVADVIRRADRFAPVVPVRATRGKALRAEPVSLLYAQGLVRHVGMHAALEDQLCDFGEGPGSPDRVDALVWAITELMRAEGGPRIRTL